jgi:anti-sigma-K factor RskA
MTSHEEMLDNVCAYALGVLPADETAAVAEHLQTCEECRNEYRLMSPVVTAVAAGVQAESFQVSPLLKERIMRQVRARPVRRAVSFWPTALAVAACVLFAFLVQARVLIVQQNRTIADLTAAKRYPFSGGAVLARDGRLYIAVRDLPQPPHGKVYQAWTLAVGAKKVAPSVTFRPARNGAALVALPVSAGRMAAVAVSVEPAGGSQQPTSKPIALVKLVR